MTPRTPHFVVCIAGPTGTGKSAAALALAEALPASVINADSRQVYRDFPLITAQPSPEEQAACPHRLYGHLGTRETLGAGAYALAARIVIREERRRNRLPVLVGGTGLYFKALLEGIAPIPKVPNSISLAWANRCRQEGSVSLHALLAEADPSYAVKIHPHDKQRILRALEVHDATGKPLTWWHERPVPLIPYVPCKIGIKIPMPELELRLERRIDAMLADGAVEEATAAFESCPDDSAPGWSGIGGAELHQYLSGKINLAECRRLWIKNTRAYAKRQNTWFRADPGIRWFSPEQKTEMQDYVFAAMDAV